MTTDPLAPVHEPGVGFSIGDYTISGTLGHGAMATVYLAHDASRHEVALKVFREGSGVSQTMLERFRREAEATKQLRRHPYILTVYATGQEGPFHYIVMELIEGNRTFEDLIEANNIGTADILTLGCKIASALEYAHEHNIVHRDVKPSNIMIDEFGEPLLSDFGVAELIDWPRCTVSGALTGTPMYMSPEQARADRVGKPSDIYSLAVVLYEAVSSELPYTLPMGPHTKHVLEAVKNEKPIPLRKHNRKFSRDLEFVLHKALEKDPRARHSTMRQFARDLECVIEGRPVRARLFMPIYRIKHLVRRHRAMISLLLVACLVAGGTFFYYKKMLYDNYAEQLMSKAWLRSAEYELSQSGLPTPQASQAARVNNALRLARRAMQQESWSVARNHFQEAVSLSLIFQDLRSASRSRLEQARCETMLGRRTEALALYQAVLDEPDATPTVAAIAEYEFILLQLLEGQSESARKTAGSSGQSEGSPFLDFRRCLLGSLSEASFEASIADLPARFQNDAHLAVAVRYHMRGFPKEAERSLTASIRESSPRSDWPGPLGRLLRSEVGK